MPSWLPSALAGLALGLTVSLLNHLILLQGQRQAVHQPPAKARNTVLARYGIRYLLNVLALFLVYKNTAMLIATAIGLTANKNYLFIKHLCKNPERKG